MTLRLCLASLGLAMLPATYFAAETKTWLQDEAAQFQRGTLRGLSVGSDGRLSLAPAVREVADPAMPYLWAVARDSRGNVYLGGGGAAASKSRLLAVNRQGVMRVAAELDGLEIHALAINGRDEVFAATSPDSKIYRIGSGGKAELFYDPHAKYVWAMAFDAKGNLLIATGDEGELHRVDAAGKGAVLFKSEETHLRSMAMDGQGNAIVGTEPGGLIVRVAPDGKSFVLHESARREITAVAVAPDGAIYAAGIGTKTPATATPAPAPAVTGTATVPPAGSPISTATLAAAARAIASTTATGLVLGPTISGGSDVLRIEPDGYAHRVWTQPTDIVYAIAFDANGLPVIGTGNRGNLYRVDSETKATLLTSLTPTQITSLVSDGKGRLLAGTGNIGKLIEVGPGLAKEGTLESDTFDAGGFSYWGRLSVQGTLPGLAVSVRSGNLDRPQQNWSAWVPVPLEGGTAPPSGRATVPPARFAQYRLSLSGDGATSPEVRAVELAYLARNVAPRITQIEVTPTNYKFPDPPSTLLQSNSLTLPAIGQRRNSPASSTNESGVTMTYAKGFVGLRWAARDDNNDDLVYRLDIRGEGESTWKPLKAEWKERRYSWDSTAFPDGRYRVRITTSDAPSNPAGQGLESNLVSEPFVIDNTPPHIDALRATRQNATVEVRWTATDLLSPLDRAEYSVNGGPWTRAEPTTRLLDSRGHEFAITLPATASEQVVAVRVADDNDNLETRAVVVR